jgi:N-formylglutamate deformylase
MILVEKGGSPLILCLPDSGTTIPPAISGRMNATGRLQTDISWRLEQVMDLHAALDATVIRSTVSRYVIDVDQSKDSGQALQTDPLEALCPVTTLDGKGIYASGEEPGPTEIEQRALLFYDPFHAAVRQELDRLRKQHERVILVDCRSMRSRIKGFIDDPLPMFSLGTLDGRSCDSGLAGTIAGACEGMWDISLAVNETFNGGYIAEAYGRPDLGIDVLTLVIAQRTYLRHESPPFEPDKKATERLKSLLCDLFSQAVYWAERRPVTPPDPSEVPAANG